MPQRINHGQKRKAVEVGITGADLADAVFSHQNCGVDVVHKVATDLGELSQCQRQQIEVPVGCCQYRKSGL